MRIEHALGELRHQMNGQINHESLVIEAIFERLENYIAAKREFESLFNHLVLPPAAQPLQSETPPPIPRGAAEYTNEEQPEYDDRPDYPDQQSMSNLDMLRQNIERFAANKRQSTAKLAERFAPRTRPDERAYTQHPRRFDQR